MPTADYNTIKAAIDDLSPPPTPSRALKGVYDGDPAGTARKFLAYALGDGIPGSDTEEMVLGWQYEGHHTDTTDPDKNWRCFKLANFLGAVGSKITSIAFSSTITPPPFLTGSKKGRQKCVAQGFSGPIVYRSADYHT